METIVVASLSEFVRMCFASRLPVLKAARCSAVRLSADVLSHKGAVKHKVISERPWYSDGSDWQLLTFENEVPFVSNYNNERAI